MKLLANIKDHLRIKLGFPLSIIETFSNLVNSSSIHRLISYTCVECPGQFMAWVFVVNLIKEVLSESITDTHCSPLDEGCKVILLHTYFSYIIFVQTHKHIEFQRRQNRMRCGLKHNSNHLRKHAIQFSFASNDLNQLLYNMMLPSFLEYFSNSLRFRTFQQVLQRGIVMVCIEISKQMRLEEGFV
jgi:hypothetical protein